MSDMLKTGNRRQAGKNCVKTAAREVEDYIRGLVAENPLEEGKKIDSEWDLSRRFGISRSSVHYALENLTRENVLYRIPGKGTFVSSSARTAALQNGKITLLLPDTHLLEIGGGDYWFNFRDIFSGLSEEAQSHGTEISVCHCRADCSEREAEKWLDGCFNNNSAEGLFFINTSGYENIIEKALRRNIPVSAWHYESQPYDTVVIDYKQAFRQAMDFLVKNGRRRILYLGKSGTGRWGAGERMDVYRQALEDSGLPLEQSLIVDLYHHPHFGFTAVSSALNSKVKFDAVVAANDIAAADAVYALKEYGMRVPDDVAVIGSDDMPGMDVFEPPLATLKVPRMQIGRHLFNLMKNRVEEPESSPVQIILKAQFVLRSSAGKQEVENV